MCIDTARVLFGVHSTGRDPILAEDQAISNRSQDLASSRSVSIVVPVYNGEASLNELAVSVAETFRSSLLTMEMILVDDGSRDDSWATIQALADDHPWITGIRMARNFGQHNALLAGIRAARYEVLVTMDDDLQHPPDQVPRMLAALGENVDLVYGTAEREEHGLLRSLASRFTKFALATAMGSPNARYVSAFRAFRTNLRDSFERNVDPSLTLDVLLSWSTTRVTCVPVQMAERRHGTSNYTVRRLLRHATNMITGYSLAPLRLVSYMGIGFSLFGWAILMYVLIRYALYGGKVPGFTFLAALIAVFSGAQMFALGILGEYLGRIHFRSMNQPQYVVRETTDPRLTLEHAPIDEMNGLQR
jgi:glycosyltransferase involved in cell wall biosynthesis